MRDEALAKFDRVTGGKMRPLGTVKARELRKILEINSGCGRVLYDSIPNLSARCCSIFKSHEFAHHRQTNENNFTAASAEFLDRASTRAARFSLNDAETKSLDLKLSAVDD